MGLAAFIAIVLKIALIRWLISLGLGIVSYTAVIYAINQAISYAKTSYNSLPLEALNMLAIAGVPEVMGIITGAIIANVTLQFAKRIAFIGG